MTPAPPSATRSLGPPQGSRPWPALAAVGIAALAIAVGFPPAQHPEQPVKLFPDSATYLTWTMGRPPAPWLFYTLVGHGWAVCVVQTILGVACWTAFGWAVLGIVGALFFALVALAQPVSLWNFTVLSEPLTLTAAAALFAATLALGRRWTAARAMFWTAAVLVFTAARVENFVVVPFLCAALLIAQPRRWRWLIGVAGATAALFIVFGVLLDKESRNWQTRMTNVVLTRILVDHELGPDFQQRGLPVDVTLLAYRGEMLKDYDPAFRAATPAFQRWLDIESRPTYLRWLASLDAQRVLMRAMDENVTTYDDPYYTAGIRLPPIGAALAPFYANAALPFTAWVSLAIVPIGCIAIRRPRRFIDLFALAFMAAVYALAFVVFHADSGELPRHMVLVAALYRLAPLVVLGCVCEVARFAPRRRVRGEAA